MRCRYWSNAAAAVVGAATLAGCGGGASRPAAFPDPGGPLDATARTVSQNSTARLELVSFRGAGGKTVPGYLGVPRRSGRHPAVVFLTGSGGSMLDFAGSALYFADHGGVGISIQQPPNAPTWAPLAENVRRALDFLAARPDVDPNRLGVAGLSLGAQTAAIVSGVDSRPKVFGLMSCRGGPVVLRYLRESHGDSFYVQNARFDEIVPRRQLLLTIHAIEAIHAPLRIRWYRTGHVLDTLAYRSEIDWLRSELHAAVN